MSAPNVSYTVSHYKYDSTTGGPVEETITGLPSSSTALRCSYSDPYNKLKITLNSDVSLTYHEIRITGEDDPWDIGVGTLWNSKNGGLAANTTHTYAYTDLPVNFEKFGQNAGESKNYRISLYSKSQADGLWDVTYLLISSDNLMPVTSNASEGIELLTDKAIPN